MKKMKKLLSIGLILMLILLTSCEETRESESNIQGEVSTPQEEASVCESNTILANDYPKIEEIDWSFRDSVQYDNPTAVFDYTNNSNYTIVLLNFQFRMKEGVSSEQLQLINPLTDELVSDEEISEMEPYVYDWIVCDPGKKAEGAICYMLYNTSPTSTDQCSFMELVSAEIDFIGEDGKRHTVSYSAENGGYLLSPTSEELYTWIDNDYTQMIPKPDTRIAAADQFKENCLGVEAYDMNRDAYIAYVDSCMEKGFEDQYPDENHDYSFSGINSQGYEIHIRYIDYMHYVEVTLKKAEN